MKKTAKIKNWDVIKVGMGQHLIGEILDHPRQGEFKERLQITSQILKLDLDNKIAETTNTIYELL